MSGEITQAVKREMLGLYGFTVGARDPRLNTDYPGAFMVVEVADEEELVRDYELPTRNGANGPWCVVGDDLEALVDAGFNYLMSLDDPPIGNKIGETLDRMLDGTLNNQGETA